MRFVPIAGGTMLAFIAGGAFAKWIDAPQIGIVFATCASLAIAAMFYRMRCKTRLAYGVVELLLATGFFYFLLLGMQRANEPKTIELITNRVLVMFAAVYFMVRALDNIGQGLSRERAERWKKLFEGK